MRMETENNNTKDDNKRGGLGKGCMGVEEGVCVGGVGWGWGAYDKIILLCLKVNEHKTGTR